jgi:hypothetical protein
VYQQKQISAMQTDVAARREAKSERSFSLQHVAREDYFAP